MRCPYCGATVRPGGRFCNQCGRRLNAETGDLSGAQQTQAQGPEQGQKVSTSLRPGDRLQNDRYVIKQILGEGGMGAVLLAEDTRLNNKLVVIKELISDSSDPAQLQEDVRNFKREVATLASVDHFLVPAVTDHFQEGSHYFMVQEYVAGENLEERLNRLGRPLSEDDVLVYASDILLVLEYLASRKPPIVHRDVKPANIIIGSNDGRAHLVDFGIARPDLAADAARKQTSALGTPGYAPPEQYQGKADPRSDLYALAATMHHLLTNRDPREHPPFVYPPVRTLNPRLSLEVEHLLTRALQNDITKRYQSASEMKQDVDQILEERFGLLGASLTTGAHPITRSRPQSGGFGYSGPTPASPPRGTSTTVGTQSGSPFTPLPSTMPSTLPAAQGPVTGPVRGQRQRQVGQAPQTPPPPPVIQPGLSGKRGYNGQMIASFLVLVLVLILIGAIALGAFSGFRQRLQGSGSSQEQSSATALSTALPANINGIGAFTIKDTEGQSELLGLSDGSIIFDTTRASGDASLKQQAAESFKAHDYASAQSYLAQAIADDTNDAEALIYQENLRVLASGSSYLTLVIGAMLSGPDVDVGREVLQGAYVAQREFNDSNALNGLKLRLLIANSGGEDNYTGTVAQQIVQEARKDRTIVGVMGWPFSSQTINAVGVLAQAQIPIVSGTASSDQLSGLSPYFFRVVPSNQVQASAGARYALQVLHAHRVAAFYDPGNTYSSSLFRDFRDAFTQAGGQIVAEEHYQRSHTGQLPTLLSDALGKNPDLIYFAGYASDITPLLTYLPTTGTFARLPVLGGDALYQPQGYGNAKQVFTRLHFTSFAYPDEWSYLGRPQPPFFRDYARLYSGNGQHSGYGYTRADFNTILAYDATETLLEAYRRALDSGGNQQSLTGSKLRQALTTISGSGAIQGLSGQISFASNGDPVDKAVVVLNVDAQGHIKIASIEGKFFK
ncbi:protein kinase domain-containing protein [Thermogemmatispora onikobensis]|uniref:protein kinase domain-containing protein n=1 Tax=Thermogemmatispora onikobensis TaxID=732234 RepID=UPI000A07201D|nr:ABC transporter substrate-binding protein [Thermogemmatispora onikobensis]